MSLAPGRETDHGIDGYSWASIMRESARIGRCPEATAAASLRARGVEPDLPASATSPESPTQPLAEPQSGSEAIGAVAPKGVKGDAQSAPPGTDFDPRERGQNQHIGPEGPICVGPVASLAKSGELVQGAKQEVGEEANHEHAEAGDTGGTEPCPEPSAGEPAAHAAPKKKARKPRPPREKKERVRVPLTARSGTLLRDFSQEARAALAEIALERLLRDFDPSALLQAAAEMRAARIPLNVLLTKYVRNPQTVEDVELKARIAGALVIIERVGGSS